jgi:ATP-dependent DNA ligase
MPPFLKRENIMLAHPVEGEGDRRISLFPKIKAADGNSYVQMFEQPKLNGERCRVEWFRGEAIFISSYGNEFRFLNRQKEQIEQLSLVFGQVQFDGEMYKHGWSRERIHSAISRKVNRNTDIDDLEFHIFDHQNFVKMQWERLRLLGEIEQEIFRKGLLLKNIKIVPYSICNEVNWLALAEDHLENGYEGIILRNPFGLYEIKRSANLLKFKPVEKDEYIIKDVNEAISLEGENKGMVGSFEVFSNTEPDGTSFNVGAGKMNHLLRIKYWEIREQLTGKTLVVKHELLRTVNKVPIAAVALSIKEL